MFVHSTSNWMKFAVVCLYLFLFLSIFFPLISFASNLFSIIWAVVGAVGAVDFVYKLKNNEWRIKVRTLAVGLLFGAVLATFSWAGTNPSIAELGLALSPLLLFGDVFTMKIR
ncbi:hypothetical protein [Pseudalkalibacillus sp. SCS-8]|uniref:hypothetical protein n=1 Tax=Pseudalkalibacillus nanhaiensis TaxID=3115291 RepID=UPI0032DBB73F